MSARLCWLPCGITGWPCVRRSGCFRAGQVIYRLLFQSVRETLNAFGRDPKRLNGTLGMTGVLHTRGQTLCR
ncbi:MAG: hypothetical protein L0Y38_01500, partial [Methylococcaceae bacterium]|nr:hypothetical protein [Methylococcaceae bacterium]